MHLSYMHYGTAGPLVVILHGMLGSGRNWHTVARRLESTFKILTPDLRNHGKSPHGEHTFDAICDDIAELIDDLGWERFHLVGHSMGGAAAMKFAFQYPDWLHSLTVVDITPSSRPGSMAPILEAMINIDLGKISSKEDVGEELGRSISSPLVRQFLLTNLRMIKQGVYKWQCNLAELYDFVRDESRLQLNLDGQFGGKTLFIGGENSEYRIDKQKSAITEHFSNVDLRLISGAGHWVHSDAPDAFLTTLTPFLSQTIA